MSKSRGKPPGTWQDDQLLKQLLDGERWIAALDDTKGPPDSKLDPSRQAWVAVLLTPPDARSAMAYMSDMARHLKDDCGADEFHFSNLFQKKEPYDRIEYAKRLQILAAFVETFCTYDIPIIVNQATDADSDLILGSTEWIRSQPGVTEDLRRMMADRTKVQFLALLVQLSKIHQRHPLGEHPMMVVADRDKDGPLRPIWSAVGGPGGSAFEGMFDPPAVLRCDPTQFPVLQLADFAAWSFSRIELTLARRPGLSERDLALWGILHPMLRQMTGPGVPAVIEDGRLLDRFDQRGHRPTADDIGKDIRAHWITGAGPVRGRLLSIDGQEVTALSYNYNPGSILCFSTEEYDTIVEVEPWWSLKGS